MRLRLPQPGSRFATAAFGCVLVSGLAGLFLLNNALGAAERAKAELDATQSATRAGSFLAMRAEALVALHGVVEPADTVRPEDVARVVARLGDHVEGFRRLWVADSAGRVVYDALVDSATGAVAPAPPGVSLRGADLDTLPRLAPARLVGRARASGGSQLAAPAAPERGESGVTVVDPVREGPRVVGFVGGTIATDALLLSMTRDSTTDTRRRLVVRAGRDTVVRHVTDGVATTVATAAFTAPGGAQWHVDVAHAPTDERALRLGLWVVGLVALGALAISLAHERRQARRIAERSRELEHLSAELIRANRTKSEFLANVSHELRTPLNAIVGFADLLKEGVYGELGPRQSGPVQRIEASATHLRHLVDQILDLAKIAAGRLEVHTETIDLRPFVFDVATEVESLVAEKGLQLSLAVPASLPRVRTDPSHLRQILVNLLGNAVKYTQRGTVAVRATLVARPEEGRPEESRRVRLAAQVLQLLARAPKPDQPWIALQVSDTGIGIPAADRDRIFDEFEQVGAGPRGESMQRGTGLGLSISRRLARLLGGDLTVESEVGKGSTFTMWLKVEPADLQAAALRQRPSEPHAQPAVRS